MSVGNCRFSTRGSYLFKRLWFFVRTVLVIDNHEGSDCPLADLLLWLILLPWEVVLVTVHNKEFKTSAFAEFFHFLYIFGHFLENSSVCLASCKFSIMHSAETLSTLVRKLLLEVEDGSIPWKFNGSLLNGCFLIRLLVHL